MSGRTVLVVGSGGREHALCLSLSAADSVGDLHCAPGNVGTSLLAENHDVSASDIDGLLALAESLSADLVVVGPEAPLCDGLADRLNEAGIACFGPVAALAHLEGSKVHAKQVMEKAGVPTAAFYLLDSSSDVDAALAEYSANPWVIKRDVLAGGKGVVVTSDIEEAKEFITSSIQTDGHVLLEQFLPGEEASMLVVMDGSGYVCLPASQDHKRVSEGDVGLNTGGMGAYCPAPVLTPEIFEKVDTRIVQKMHEYLSAEPTPYRGVLYVGLMITESGEPSVVEFNVRFGDPECQVTLPLVSSDMGELLFAAATDSLSDFAVEFHSAHALTVVLANEGYPGTPVKGRPIIGLDSTNAGLPAVGAAWVNHAGVGGSADEPIATGGRVLSCSAMAGSLKEAAELAYERLNSLELEGSHFRRDIGHRAL